jgi:hypothetical protein
VLAHRLGEVARDLVGRSAGSERDDDRDRLFRVLGERRVGEREGGEEDGGVADGLHGGGWS